MAGSKEGGAKAHASLRARLGEEGYREHMANIGARGGKAQVPKGLSFTRGRMAQELHKSRTQPSQRAEQV